MSSFREKLEELVGQEVMLRVTEGDTLDGILKEVGEDYLIMEVARGGRRIYNLRNISNIAEIPK